MSQSTETILLLVFVISMICTFVLTCIPSGTKATQRDENARLDIKLASPNDIDRFRHRRPQHVDKAA